MDYIDAKTVIRRCKPIWNYLWYDYAMDIYRGCSHGCIYCYARSSYYEKTDNFSCIRAKKDVLRIIRDELRRKAKSGVVLMGGVADPYNPKERELELSRHALELLNAFEFGACIITKSNLATRDADILTDIGENAPASVNFSITCSDDEMSKKLEPYVATTTQRFQAIEYLSQRGITTGVLMDPMIPFITDNKDNVIEMVKKAKAYGAAYMYISTRVTMADIQRQYFLQEAEKICPGYTERFEKRYKEYYRCWSYDSKRLWNVFVETCEKENMKYNMRTVNQTILSKYGNINSIF